VLLHLASRLFDRLQGLWEGRAMRRAVAAALVVAFVVALAAIEAGRRGLLPQGLARHLPANHLGAVGLAFYLLLGYEVVGLVFGIAQSVGNAAGKQFEIFSLILLRHSFEEFGHLGEPVVFADSTGAVLRMLSNGFGALLVFVVLGLYYREQRHRPLSADLRDTKSFIASKKVVALVLLAIFALLAGRALVREDSEFFESFYTVLVLADVLVVLLSLRYSASYGVVFRNSGLAVATVLLRMGLAAPPYFNVALGIASAVFALGLTVAFNWFAPVLVSEGAGGSREAGSAD
jgi:hypothetical protein